MNTCPSCGGSCRCPHHKAVPVFITLIGLVFLLEALDVVTAQFAGIAWPVLIICIGFQKFAGNMCSCCGPGAVTKK